MPNNEQKPPTGLHVLALEANNFMRIKAVRVVPRGSVVEITGRNGAGKTSVMDAIYCTLAGASSLPHEPLRAGQQSGETYVDLGELRVTRTYTAAGTTSLKVESRDGNKVKSPQKILDRLVSLVAFDPLDFASAAPAVQAEILRKLVGLDLTDLDERAARWNEERADLQKSLHAQQFEYQAYGPDSDWEHVPDQPVSVAEIMERLKAANAERLAVLKKRTAYRDLCAEQGQRIAASDKANADVEKLRRRLEEAKAVANDAAESVRAVAAMIERQKTEIESLLDPDTSTIEQEVRDSEEINRHVRRKQERQALAEAIAGNHNSLASLYGKQKQLKSEKASRLASVQFPVEGLGFTEDGGGVTLRGVPVAQASTAETIVLGLGIAAAMSPRLRVARIKDGSLLDDDTLAAVAAWAAANEWQVWIEKVGNISSQTGVIIEDGEVYADRQPGVEPTVKPRFGAAALAALEESEDQDVVLD